jgi:MFS family permease
MAFMDRVRGRPAHAGTPGDGRDVVATERQHDEYGGTNWGAAFFGWIVAVGIGALLTALLSAAGAAIALTELTGEEAADSAETISLIGGIALLLVALISYFAGGYVAGRMSRFDGSRQGLGVWIVSIVVAIVLAVLGAIAGSEYNVLGGLELPRIPIDEGDLTTGGVIFLIATLLGTLLAAMAGGKAGERYHRKVDALGAHPAATRHDGVAPRDRTVDDRTVAHDREPAVRR